MNEHITIVENPHVQDYSAIKEQYFGKWVALYQPDDELVFDEGTVLAYGDCELDLWDDLWHILDSYKDGVGSVERFKEEEDWGAGLVDFHNVQ